MDISSFSTRDLMMRDFKLWEENGLRFGISVVPVEVDRWLERTSGLFSDVRAFAEAKGLLFYLIMAYHLEDGELRREIIGYSPDGSLLEWVCSSLLKPLLELGPPRQTLPSEIVGNFIVYGQKKTRISRKILAPELRRHFISAGFSADEKGSDDRDRSSACC